MLKSVRIFYCANFIVGEGCATSRSFYFIACIANMHIIYTRTEPRSTLEVYRGVVGSFPFFTLLYYLLIRIKCSEPRTGIMLRALEQTCRRYQTIRRTKHKLAHPLQGLVFRNILNEYYSNIFGKKISYKNWSFKNFFRKNKYEGVGGGWGYCKFFFNVSFHTEDKFWFFSKNIKTAEE